MGAYLYGEQRGSLYALDDTHAALVRPRGVAACRHAEAVHRFHESRARLLLLVSARRDSAVLEARRWLPLGIPRVSRTSSGIAMRHSAPEVSHRETDDKPRKLGRCYKIEICPMRQLPKKLPSRAAPVFVFMVDFLLELFYSWNRNVRDLEKKNEPTVKYQKRTAKLGKRWIKYLWSVTLCQLAPTAARLNAWKMNEMEVCNNLIWIYANVNTSLSLSLYLF